MEESNINYACRFWTDNHDYKFKTCLTIVDLFCTRTIIGGNHIYNHVLAWILSIFKTWVGVREMVLCMPLLCLFMRFTEYVCTQPSIITPCRLNYGGDLEGIEGSTLPLW